MNRPLLLSVLALLLCQCGAPELGVDVNDHFFLRHDQAVMPVAVHGNTASGVMLVYLHGGPGYTAFDAYQEPNSPFTRLQADYAVVYWDQRCAGNAQGNCDYEQLELAQFAEDLHQLLTLLRHRYGAEQQIFLLGHSWGGSLGIDYLSQADHQAGITGWIEVAGGHDVPRIAALEREMIRTMGTRQIAQGNRVAEWTDLIAQADAISLDDTPAFFEMNRLARRSEELMAAVDSVERQVPGLTLSDYFFSHLDLDALPRTGEATVEATADELVQLSLTDRLPSITVPTLMIWGRYDFRVPPTLAQQDLPRYGATDKTLIVIDRAAHFVFWDQPEAFYQAVWDFIERQR